MARFKFHLLECGEGNVTAIELSKGRKLRGSVWLLPGVAMLSLWACGQQGLPVESAKPLAGTVSPASWASGITLGTPGNPRRGIGTELPKFTTDEAIQLRANVSDAPANAAVRVVWIDAAGKVMRDETQTTRAGDNQMTFMAPGYLSWKPGDYQARLLVDGQKVYEQPFRIIAAAGM